MIRHGYVSLVVAVLSGCVVHTPPSALFQKVVRSGSSPDEVRVQVREMARRLPGQLEVIADRLAAEGPQPIATVRMARFKSNAIPAFQDALLEPEPIGALVDGWALLAQLQDAVPKEAQWASQSSLREAGASLARLESEVKAVWRQLTLRTDISAATTRVHQWAREHPLDGTLLTRASTQPLLASLTVAGARGPLQALAAAQEDLRDLTVRLDLYSGTLPKQARWQAEMLAGELSEGKAFQTALDALQESQRLLHALPDIARNEKANLQDFVTEQRQSIMADVDRQRTALLDGAHAEVVAAQSQLDNNVRRWMESAQARVESLLNRLFVMALILLLVGIAGAVTIVHFAQRPNEDRDHRGLIPHERHP